MKNNHFDKNNNFSQSGFGVHFLCNPWVPHLLKTMKCNSKTNLVKKWLLGKKWVLLYNYGNVLNIQTRSTCGPHPLCVDWSSFNKYIIKRIIILNLNIHNTYNAFNKITHKTCQVSHNDINWNILKLNQTNYY